MLRHIDRTRLSSLAAPLAALCVLGACTNEQGLDLGQEPSPSAATVFQWTGPVELPAPEEFVNSVGLTPTASASTAADDGVGTASATLVSSTPTASAGVTPLPSYGANISLDGDWCRFPIEIGFPFTFAGKTFTQAGVSANGNIALGICNSSPSQELAERGYYTIAPAKGDWFMLPGSPNNVYVQTVGTKPYRQFIVTWNNIFLTNTPTGLRNTFWLILREGTNTIQFSYPSLLEVVAGWRATTAGLYADNLGPIAVVSGADLLSYSGESICFTPQAGGGYSWTKEECPDAKPKNVPPTASAGGPYDVDEGTPLLLDGSLSADADGDALAFAWSFGDGQTGSGGTVSHTYADQGNYAVALEVSDGKGGTASATTTARVRNVPPSVGYASTMSMSVTPLVSGQTATLSARFADPGVLDAPWKWSIDWGNGDVEHGETADLSQPITGSRRLLVPGSYVVTLHVEDKDGGVGSMQSFFTVAYLPLSFEVKVDGRVNWVDKRSRRKIPVVIFSTPAIDVREIDVSSVRFAGAAPAAHGNGGDRLADVDGDGDLDLELRFEVADIAAAGEVWRGTESVNLRATLTDGRQASGAYALPW